MAEIISIGVAKIEMGAIEADGSMGTVLTDVGEIYRGTAQLMEEDPQETPHYGEKTDEPIVTIDVGGKTTLKFTIVDLDPDKLILFKGGTKSVVATKDAWNKPKTLPAIEQSLKVTSVNGIIINIPRAKIVAKLNWNLTRTEIAKVEVTATILEPTNAAASALQLINP